MNKDKLYLESIRECLERIEEYSAADEDAFMDSCLIQDGVIRNLELIGEATKNLSAELRAANPEIPWRQIAGTRDVLIHDYLKVNLARVWNTVDTDLPPLRATVLSGVHGAITGRRKLPWCYRWPDAVQGDVLARLPALNDERYKEEEEVAVGLRGKGRGPHPKIGLAS